MGGVFSRSAGSLEVSSLAIGLAIHTVCMVLGAYCFGKAARIGRAAEPQPAAEVRPAG
jgi:hypothetical protein